MYKIDYDRIFFEETPRSKKKSKNSDAKFVVIKFAKSTLFF